jgi:PhnB protein
MQVNPYLSFNGNCEEAFNYYAKVLGGTINDMMTAENTPMAAEMPPDRVKKIMHAKITIDGEVLMASDVPPEHYQTPQGMHVSLHPSEPEEAERIFASLAEGGTIQMPIAQTFWARRFGVCVDRFGIPWLVNCE